MKIGFPLKRLTEGSAELFVPIGSKISKELPVFYNPVMKLNRDISILLLKQFPKMTLCDLMAGTGIRAIRFARELKYKSITANDISKNAIRLIKKNMKMNKVKFEVKNEDADIFLLKSKGFDYIDVDPFGSSNFFLDSAIKRISRDGVLAITNTDTAALTGTYEDACIRKYWALPKRDYMMHETGLRILIRKIQLIGMQYEKALFPIFSYFRDHYFRIYFKSVKGKKECGKIAKNHGMFNNSGPLWTGNLWDDKLANKIYFQALKDKSKMNFDNLLINFLKIIKEESKIDSVGFYDMHAIAKNKKIKVIMKKEGLIKKIKNDGYKVSETHFSGTGIRSNISYDKLIRMINQ